MSVERFSGLTGISNVGDFDLADKVVFLRVDFNVPLNHGSDGKITISDETRIRAALPTIDYILEKKGKIVIASHLGRPKTEDDKEKFSLEPVALRLGELIDKEVLLIEDPSGDAVKGLLPALKNQVILLENLRFEKGETQNSYELASSLAEYTDVYINDAFGASHRAHASMHALPKLIREKGVGFLVKKEIEALDELRISAKKPFYVILGGAKVSDKIKVIQELQDSVDGFFIGGAMAYTFLKAKGINVGKSLVEKESLSYAKDLIERLDVRGKKLFLPIDHIVAEDYPNGSDSKSSADCRETKSEAIDDGWMGLDIGPRTEKLFDEELFKAKTIFWNGPMGVFEVKEFSSGTFSVAKTLGALSETKTVVGGGDSVAAMIKSGYADKINHISTGGGASLEYLQGDVLPGIEILKSKTVESEDLVEEVTPTEYK